MPHADLPDLLERGAGPPAEPQDAAVLWQRGRRRRRSKRTAALAGMVAAVALAVVAIPALLEGPTPPAIDPAAPPAGTTLPDVVLPDRDAAPAEMSALREPTTSMVVATRDGTMTFIDVDARDMVTWDLPELATGDPPERLVAGDRLVLYGGDTTYTMDPHPHAQPEAIVEHTDFSVFVPSGLPDRIWVRPGRTDGTIAPISQVDLDGNVLLGPTDSPDGNLAIGLRDQVVLQAGSRLIVWDPTTDEIVVEVDGPFPMGTDGDRFAWCDAACRNLHVTDPATGTTHLVAAVPEPAAFTGYSGRMSPDGRFLATPVCTGIADERHCALAVLDLHRERSWTVADGWIDRAPAWSPDSRWVFAPLTDGRLAAYQPGNREAAVVPIDALQEPYGFGVIAAP